MEHKLAHYRVKTELRNRLSVSSLDALLHILLEGPEREFDFNAAVMKWSQMRKHRIIIQTCIGVHLQIYQSCLLFF